MKNDSVKTTLTLENCYGKYTIEIHNDGPEILRQVWLERHSLDPEKYPHACKQLDSILDGAWYGSKPSNDTPVKRR